MSIISRPSGRRQAGLLAIILLSACTAPLFRIGGVTFTGDRLLGLAAVMAVAAIALRGGLRWTPVHAALALFAGIQMLTSILAMSAWPQGPKFATVYVLGFACFALTAACAGGAAGARQGARLWITVGAVLGVVGAFIGVLANLWRSPIWGSGVAEVLAAATSRRDIFAAKVTFQEWNLYSSFLVVAFALALWSWRSEVGGDLRRWAGLLSVGGIVQGLVFGLTRAAWVDMAALAALWLWARRPPWRRVAALVLLVAFGFLVQAFVIGASPLYPRILRPLSIGWDHNIAVRVAINSRTIESWRERPILGKGAGSTKNVEVRWFGALLQDVWNGNIVLFVLHDSGLLGLAAFVALLAVVARAGQRALRRGPDDATRSVLVPLLAVGVALLFAYQFTHALWMMYPYVYLGLLTASTESGAPGC